MDPEKGGPLKDPVERNCPIDGWLVRGFRPVSRRGKNQVAVTTGETVLYQRTVRKTAPPHCGAEAEHPEWEKSKKRLRQGEEQPYPS